MNGTPIVDDLTATEGAIARDLARRAIWVAPVFLLLGVVGWGINGLLSSALALVLVAVNFRLGAAIISRAAQISINALYGAVLGGYVARLALMTAVVLTVSACHVDDAGDAGITAPHLTAVDDQLVAVFHDPGRDLARVRSHARLRRRRAGYFFAFE